MNRDENRLDTKDREQVLMLFVQFTAQNDKLASPSPLPTMQAQRMQPPRTSLCCLVFPCFFEGWKWAVLLGREEMSNAVLGSCGSGKGMSTPEQSGP